MIKYYICLYHFLLFLVVLVIFRMGKHFWYLGKHFWYLGKHWGNICSKILKSNPYLPLSHFYVEYIENPLFKGIAAILRRCPPFPPVIPLGLEWNRGECSVYAGLRHIELIVWGNIWRIIGDIAAGIEVETFCVEVGSDVDITLAGEIGKVADGLGGVLGNVAYMVAVGGKDFDSIWVVGVGWLWFQGADVFTYIFDDVFTMF
jgi:hypothetical protein